MKIILANLAPEHEKEIKLNDPIHEKKFSSLHFPIGLGIIAGVLKENNIDFDTFDTYVEGRTEDFINKLEEEKYDLVMMSGFLGNYMYPFIINLTKELKKIVPATTLIIGGPIATTVPELLIRESEFDFVAEGEGEVTILELIETIKNKEGLENVKGLYIKNDKKALYTGARERLHDLDSQSPFPFYDAFKIETYIEYLNRTGRCWEISGSRGCYGNCSFCKLTFGKKITFYSNRIIIDHMKEIHRKYGINRFNFVDDNLLNNIRRAEEFVSFLENEDVSFKWRFQGRADTISPKFVERAIKVGLFDISFGIESADQIILNKYNKKIDIEKALENLKEIKNIVDIHCNFIVGAPGENWNSVKKTANFIKDLKLNNAGIGILTLFPCTALYDSAVKSGLINNEHEYCMNLGPVFTHPYINISELNDEELLQAQKVLVEVAAEFGGYI